MDPSSRWHFLVANQRRVHLIMILALLVCASRYKPAKYAHFNFDDYKLVVLNPTIRDVSQIPTVLASGRPIRGLTLMIDYQLFGLDPMGFHLHNVFWHFLGTVLLYFWIWRVFRRTGLALVCSVLFCLHPVQTEAVMAIAHRKELLAFSFMMLSYHAYLYRPRFPKSALVFTGLFFILGILSKQVVIILPLILAAHEWLKSGASFKARYVWFVVPLAFIGAAAVAGGVLLASPYLRDFNLFGRVAPQELMDMDYGRILATSFNVFPRYLRYLLFPAHLCVTPIIETASWEQAGPWMGLSMFLALPAAAVLARKDFLVSFSLMWVCITLLPIMNWIPSNAFFAERYLYAPCAGFCLLLIGLLSRLYHSRHELFSERSYRIIGLMVLFFIMWHMLSSPFTLRINAIWPRQGMYLLDRALALGLSALVFALVGTLLYFVAFNHRPFSRFSGKWWAEFIFCYIIMLVTMTGTVLLVEWMVSRHLGLPERDFVAEWQRMRGWLSRHALPGPRSEQSLLYPKETYLNEWWVLVYHMVGGAASYLFLYRLIGRRLGLTSLNKKLAFQIFALIIMAAGTAMHVRANDWASEVRLWAHTVLEEPRSLHGWNNLGKAYMERRRYDLAADAYQKTVELNPKGAANYRNLGIARLYDGQYRRAGIAFEKAIALDPRDIASRNNLANILVQKAQKKNDPAALREAIQHYLKIIEQDPNNAHAYHNLAWCYLMLGDLAAAERNVMHSLSLNPQSEKSLDLREKIMDARRMIRRWEEDRK